MFLPWQRWHHIERHQLPDVEEMCSCLDACDVEEINFAIRIHNEAISWCLDVDSALRVFQHLLNRLPGIPRPSPFDQLPALQGQISFWF